MTWTRHVGWILAAALALSGGGCGEPAEGDDCARRICSTGGGGGGGGGGDVDAGPGAGDADGGGGTPTDGGAGRPTDGGGTGCTPDWQCTSWETACDGSDDATRECVDANDCGVAPPASMTSTTLEPLDVDFFRCKVQPILDYGCDQFACHGTDDHRPLRVYSRVMWREDPIVRGLEGPGSADPLTNQEWCRNYDSARSFYTSDPANSELVTQPLDTLHGGLAHVGVNPFRDTSDPDYQTLLQWLGGATLGSCDAGFNEHP